MRNAKVETKEVLKLDGTNAFRALNCRMPLLIGKLERTRETVMSFWSLPHRLANIGINLKQWQEIRERADMEIEACYRVKSLLERFIIADQVVKEAKARYNSMRYVDPYRVVKYENCVA